MYSCSACLNSPAWKYLFPCSLYASACAVLTVGSGPAILISFFCGVCLVVKMRWSCEGLGSAATRSQKMNLYVSLAICAETNVQYRIQDESAKERFFIS